MTTTSITNEPSIDATDERKREFYTLATQWHHETDHLSSMTRKLAHPAYQRIIGMGSAIVPVLLQELSERPGYWFRALAAVTGENPVSPGSNFEQARTAWLAWGRQHGHNA